MNRTLKRLIGLGAVSVFLTVSAVFIVDRIVESSSAGITYNSTETIPFNRVGLLLGVAKTLPDGSPNLYYKHRIDATLKLHKAKKIKYILVSGDNCSHDYDEPTTMKDELIERGIPADRIFLDYAGFRTFDSVVRSKEIFGQKSITVISQKFHNERAIYIASKKNIRAIGFNARSVDLKYGFKTQFRERFARLKMVMDLVFGTDPKFLGEKVSIPSF